MVQSHGNVMTKGTQLSNQKVISKQFKFSVFLHQQHTQSTAAILLPHHPRPLKDSGYLLPPLASASLLLNCWSFTLSPLSHSTSQKPRELMWSLQSLPQRWNLKRRKQAQLEFSDGLRAGRG